MIDTIKNLIEKKSTEFGGHGNVALLREAYHACCPLREHGWDCDAIRIDGDAVEIGKVSWDFNYDTDDASDYDWDFDCDDDFDSVDTFDLSDDDDAKHVLSLLK